MKYLIERIADGVTMISESSDGVHMFLVEGETSALLIDSGTGCGNVRRQVEKLTDKPIILVNTHGHYDHIGGNWLFDFAYIDEKDVETAKCNQSGEYLRKMIRKMTSPAVYLLATLFKRKMLYPKPTKKFETISDGHVFALGGREVTVIETAGHTKGSICLKDDKSDIIFLGDSVCKHLVLLGGIEFCDTPKHYIESLLRLKTFIGEGTRLYSNHHENPVEREYIDKYVACAEKIITSPSEGERVKYGTAEWLYMPYEDVKLSFDK